MLIGWGNRQRLYRERTNGRWGLMGVGSERGIAVLSRVELYGGGESYLISYFVVKVMMVRIDGGE
ncbi:hypothetical protein ASPFODRAFT_43796 [Aspergillus luchuensis CBS 106.47]|uniref:Uncharacterized protein n=1 Tax=Aspergillus luchuensis (strain CBS 106.47) TaxID=1137211 RepID=A0A1M3TN44_ASPLC|nr:hypothetical protein ASPFODRAFT_43796 [Aspergillus luchuensis CBS 106.47]